jgi:hypothetical protein
MSSTLSEINAGLGEQAKMAERRKSMQDTRELLERQVHRN